MNTLAERVIEARESVDMNPAEFARAIKMSRSGVLQIEDGTTKTLRLSTALNIEALTGYRTAWLRDGSLPKKTGRSGDGSEQGIPVVANVQFGDEGYWQDTEHPTGHGEGFIVYPTRDKNAYALRGKGDSMRPRIKPGEYVVILPGHQIAMGDEVMVQTKNGRSMIKQLGSRRNGAVELISINENDHRPITLEESEIVKMHYVAAIVKDGLYRTMI